jgi:hypothetical protein
MFRCGDRRGSSETRVVVGLLVAASLLTAGTAVYFLRGLLWGHGTGRVGDGKHPASYGFDLSHANIPVERITGGGVPKDGIPALEFPSLLSAAQVEALKGSGRNKYLVDSDRVLGVSIDGAARAYPLLVLEWHEVANDTLSGRPIAVTYSPLCDAAVVFHRRVGDQVLRFGVSGLLYNSNLLLFDRRPEPGEESLWSQLLGRAVAGPGAAAGVRLQPIDCAVVRWQDWRAQHPETTVIDRLPSMYRAYLRQPYLSYFGNDVLRFPVEPLPPHEERPYKTPVLVVDAGGARGVYPLPLLASRAGPEGTWRTAVGDHPVLLCYRDDPPTAWAEGGDPRAPIVSRYAFWFAWYAMHPEDAELIPASDAPASPGQALR